MAGNQSSFHAEIDNLNRQAWELLDQNKRDQGIALALRAQMLAESFHPVYALGVAQSLTMKAEGLRQRGQYIDALANAQHAIELYADSEPSHWLIYAWTVAGNAYEHLGSLAAALEAYQEQLRLAELIGNEIGIAVALRHIGVLHMMRGNFSLAFEYHFRSIDIAERDQNIAGLGTAFTNLCLFYRMRKDLDTALYYGRKAIITLPEGKYTTQRALAHNHLAMVYACQGDFDTAFATIQSAWDLAEQSGQHYPRISVLKSWGDIYRQAGDQHTAHNYLQQALRMTLAADDLYEASLCYELLSDIATSAGNHQEALEHYKAYHHLQDQIRQQVSELQFAHLEVHHRTRQARAEAEQERALREKDREYFEKLSAMKDEFLSAATHDLKNPLASIKLHTHLLRRIAALDEPALGYLNRIDQTVERMRSLVTNLLDLARIETGKSLHLEAADLDTLLSSVIAEYMTQTQHRGIRLAFINQASGSAALCDAVQIQRVLHNLLSNAFKFTPDGGAITVTAAAAGCQAEISVQDTGIGIPEDALTHIFDRFFRVEDDSHKTIEGTGLGLAICKSIVEQHQGKIWAENIEPGLRIVFTLPLVCDQ